MPPQHTPAPASVPTPIPVKVFIGSPFEIGEPGSGKAGEFQHWYHHSFLTKTQAFTVQGLANPVFLNARGVMGTVIGIGKVRSATTMTALLADPRFDFSQTCFLVNGCAGTPPNVGTLGAVFWADYLVDYDLGHRWAAGETPPGAPLFSLREGHEEARVLRLNPALVDWAFSLTRSTPLHDSPTCCDQRAPYPQTAVQHTPFVGVGTHLAGDSFFHGPGLSREAALVCQLNHASPYSVTEMEGVAVGCALARFGHADRLLSLRGVVNFDQGHPGQTTLEHLHGDGIAIENQSAEAAKTAETEALATPFDVGIRNVFEVGSRFVDHLLTHWDEWLMRITAPSSTKE